MKINTVKDVNKFVRSVLLDIYGEGFPNKKIPCTRTYSEAYNKGKSWRYKWYKTKYASNACEHDLIQRMMSYTQEILAPRMLSLFKTNISLHYSSDGQSLILTAKPAKV